MLLLLLSHINCWKIPSVRGHAKRGARALGRSEKPNNIKIRPGDATLSRLKSTIRRMRTNGMTQECAQTALTHGRGYPLNYIQHSVPSFPHLTNSRLQITAVGLYNKHFIKFFSSGFACCRSWSIEISFIMSIFFQKILKPKLVYYVTGRNRTKGWKFHFIGFPGNVPSFFFSSFAKLLRVSLNNSAKRLLR